MRKQCIVAILAILFSVMMASTAVPFGLPDSGAIPEEVPEIPEEVPEIPEVPEILEELPELLDELPDPFVKSPPPGGLPVITKIPSEIVSEIKNQGMALTDEHDILRIGTNGCVLTNITEETGYRWAIGNKSIELIGDGNRKISPEDLKKLIGEKGIVLEYTWQIGNEGIELIGENGTVPSEDLQEFMENPNFYLIGTTPIDSTAEESTETDSTVVESEKTDSTGIVEESTETALDEEDSIDVEGP
jgi:hypothetical protein